ncbi:MAG: UDP-3-O-acyl-N-acetylglucosamine deacetylase [Bdellovibrionales bacterium]
MPVTLEILTAPRHETSEGFSPSALVAAAPVLQRTLRGTASCSGIGVHSGDKVAMRLVPAPEDTGVVFIRTDLKNGARRIEARWDNVVDTRLCTVIGNKSGARVATIEHLMAALRAYDIDNVYVEIDGAEVPVMDGSSDYFVFLIEMAGIQTQKTPRRVIEVLRPVEIRSGNKLARFTPAQESRFSFDIEFNRKPIKDQSYEFTLSPNGFKSEISRARTFGFFEEVDMLRQQGLARGGSLQNAIVIKDEKILNEDGLRYADEFVRHKLLDAVGDLALAGAPILGHFHGYCSGHALNNQLLHALFADPLAWREIDAEEMPQLAVA